MPYTPRVHAITRLECMQVRGGCDVAGLAAVRARDVAGLRRGDGAAARVQSGNASAIRQHRACYDTPRVPRIRCLTLHEGNQAPMLAVGMSARGYALYEISLDTRCVKVSRRIGGTLGVS